LSSVRKKARPSRYFLNLSFKFQKINKGIKIPFSI